MATTTTQSLQVSAIDNAVLFVAIFFRSATLYSQRIFIESEVLVGLKSPSQLLMS